MHMILISRAYRTKYNTMQVSLLQDTDTLAKLWEVRVVYTVAGKSHTGAITRRKTRTEAMRIVRRALYAA